jgi:hypothetical protein
MLDPFAADHLDVERLLKEWRWLAVGPMTLVARTVFGDLFLRDESNAVFWLDATAARLSKLTNRRKARRLVCRIRRARNV